MSTFEPAYRQLARGGELRRRVEEVYAHLSACDLCGQNCRLDRRVTQGVCRTGTRANVSSYGPHLGEEDPLRGWLGSGTVFFTNCNLKCQFCGEPATGSPTCWRYPASKYHYWQWRTVRLRKARLEWERTRTPYQREVLGTFESDQERARFLAQHVPTYPTGA